MQLNYLFALYDTKQNNNDCDYEQKVNQASTVVSKVTNEPGND